jgi:hypothetical protein
MAFDTAQPQQLCKGLKEKIVILEESQKSQIDCYAYPEPYLSFQGMAGFADQDSAAIIEKRRKNQKKKKSPVPTGIKKVTGSKQQKILFIPSLAAAYPVQAEYQREKQPERYFSEQHLLSVIFNSGLAVRK